MPNPYPGCYNCGFDACSKTIWGSVAALVVVVVGAAVVVLVGAAVVEVGVDVDVVVGALVVGSAVDGQLILHLLHNEPAGRTTPQGQFVGTGGHAVVGFTVFFLDISKTREFSELSQNTLAAITARIANKKDLDILFWLDYQKTAVISK
jgi:hypothetical protein